MQRSACRPTVCPRPSRVHQSTEGEPAPCTRRLLCRARWHATKRCGQAEGEREMGKSHETGEPNQLYRKTEVLSLGRHGRLGLAAEGDYRFAKALLSVPASMSEIVIVQRVYPVVFAGAEAPIPVIVLGLSEKTGNVFVDAEGRWAEDQYVPAFLRRYPFVAVPKPGGRDLALAADLGSEFIVEDGARPFAGIRCGHSVSPSSADPIACLRRFGRATGPA